jgi:membrane fusion protein (multidrug efflux system)
MKQYLILGSAVIMLISSCGGNKKDGAIVLGEKRAALEQLKSDKVKLEEQIKKVEGEIDLLDPTKAGAQKPKLVSVQTLQLANFDHFIELQGKIDAENTSIITPRGAPGQVKAVYVQKGSYVKKGQLLLKLDDAIVRQNVAAALQGIESIKTQLAFAKNIYQRQKNLWDQNIGSEVQLITAKNNVATLENQLKATDENVKIIQEQLNTTNVVSDVDGVANEVNIKVGEIFQGMSGLGIAQIKIVNNSVLKVVGNIPENYLTNVTKGTPVETLVQDLNKTFTGKLTFVGASIDPLSRGFIVESKLPTDPLIKPNQIALMKIKDYSATNVISIPIGTLQNDENGKFVMVASTEAGKLLARKRPVIVGLINGEMLEVKSGLKAGDVLVTAGFQSLYEGQSITIK